MNKVLVAGSSGMIGQLVLSHCLNSSETREVISLVRKPTGVQHKKLNEIIVNDFLDYTRLASFFKQVDVIYYCVGVYTGTVNRADFRKITIEYPLALAKVVVKKSPAVRFVLLSGQGADRTEKSKFMFALDKGIIENQLNQLFGNVFYSCRPGYIYPVTPRKEPNFTYVLSRKLYPLLKLMGKKMSITSVELALAMFRIGMEQPSRNTFENNHLKTYLESV